MRIKSQSQDTLVLESRPILLAAAMILCTLVCVYFAMMSFDAGDPVMIVVSLFFAALFAGFFFSANKRVLVVFDRTAGYVTLVQRSFRATSEQRFPLSRVKKARLEETQGVDRGNAWRPVLDLVVPKECVVLVETYRTSYRAEDSVNAINAWIRQHASRGARSA